MSLTKINNINYFIFLNIENLKYKVFSKYHGKITYFLYGTHFDVSFHNMNKNYVKLLPKYKKDEQHKCINHILKSIYKLYLYVPYIKV